jgi:hypothetical protein
MRWPKTRRCAISVEHALPINRRRGVSQAIEYLDAANIIPPRLTSMIRDLYSVRTSAAHPTGHTTFSRHEVLNFRDASDIVVKELDELIAKTAGQPPKP